jgi:hypothetical protein
MVRLRTLDPPIGVRLPASQLFKYNKLNGAFTALFFSFHI